MEYARTDDQVAALQTAARCQKSQETVTDLVECTLTEKGVIQYLRLEV